MAADTTPEQPVPNPTWMSDIRTFFTSTDKRHMAGFGIDLSTYDGVRKQAINIYFMTSPPNPQMPPDPAAKWSAARVETFKNWIGNGYPMGAATAQPAGAAAVEEAPATGRVRKNVTSLTSQEVDALRAAFEGIMARPPDDPNGYFALAGIHGRPQQYCLHHVNPFHPWHRAYIKAFEDQLRSIPGCEDVTLPYWDISLPLPDLLQQPPFANYTLPADIGGGYYPCTTSRYSPEKIAQNVQDSDVVGELEASIAQALWGAYQVGGFQKFAIQAHDSGHVSIGTTMANQDVASYDPVFWFFHCNLDRLWLKWQERVGATTLEGFKSTLAGDTAWLSPPINALPPLDATSDETISYGIAYDEEGVVGAEDVQLENKVGSLEAARGFTVKRSSPVSVRVKDINRLAIPGSFWVDLLADGERIARRGFFQPKTPTTCETCATVPRVNIDFRLDAEQILDRQLSVAIEVPELADMGPTRFPLARAGNPTVNVRMLLDEE